MANSSDTRHLQGGIAPELELMAGVGSWTWDAQKDVFQCSAGLLAIFGLEEAPTSPPELWACIHPGDRQETRPRLEQALQGHTSCSVQYRLLKQPDRWIREKVARSEGAGSALILGVVQDISEEVRNRFDLVKHVDHLGLAQRLSGMGSWEYDPETRDLWVSDGFYRLFGLNPATDRIDLDFLKGLVSPGMLDTLTRNVRLGGEDGRIEFTHVHRLPSGQIRHFWVSGQFVPRANRSRGVLVGVVQNVTARQALVRRLQESESRLRLAVKGGNLGVWDWHVPSGRVIFDEGWAEMLGMKLDQVPQHIDAWAKRVHPDDWEHVQAVLQAHFRRETSLYECEHRVLGEDGIWRWIMDRGEVVEWTAEGEPIRMVGIHMEISRLKETQLELERSEANLTALLDASPDLFVLTDRDCKVIRANRVFWEKVLGAQTPREEVVLKDIFPAEEQGEIGQVFNQVWNGYSVYCSRKTHLFGAQEAVLTCHHVPVRRSDGTIFAMASSMVDLTNKLTVQRQLADLNERLQLALKAGNIGVWDTDMVKGVNLWDEGMAAIYGIDLAEFDPTPYAWLRYMHPDDMPRLEALDQQMQQHKDTRFFRVQFRIVRPNGEIRHVLSLAHVHRDSLGDITRMVGINWDETDKVVAQEALISLNARLEEEVLQRTQELRASNAELEHFAYSVSHDLRTPLRHLTSFSRLLHRRLEGQLEGENLELLLFLYEAAEKMHRQVEDLLAYSRIGRKEIHPQWVELEGMVKDIWEAALLALPDPERASLQIDSLGQVYADPLLLEQALQNLVGNALKYSAAKPRIFVRITTQSTPEGTVLAVEDKGIGFDMRHHDRIFTVFQRLHTEEEYEGNGIGLSNVQRIAKRHGGRVWAEGVPGEGATFFLLFPDPDPEEEALSQVKGSRQASR
ncbi:MAG: PAS domain S-box protein [Bacteroidetes bacterium]|nr:MAG: PAS domain S-box protein [Bacteroidota bacterium]